MKIALRVVLALFAGLLGGLIGGYAGLKGPDYHPHDPVGPLIFMLVGAVAGFVVCLLAVMLVAFLAFPVRRE